MAEKEYNAFDAAARRFLRGTAGTILITVLAAVLQFLQSQPLDAGPTLEIGLGVSVLMALDKYARAKSQ